MANYNVGYELVQTLNQVIIWDKIVQAGENKVLKLKKEFVKYALIDQGAELR
jgi:signal peptidase complex subunit 3